MIELRRANIYVNLSCTHSNAREQVYTIANTSGSFTLASFHGWHEYQCRWTVGRWKLSNATTNPTLHKFAPPPHRSASLPQCAYQSTNTSAATAPRSAAPSAHCGHQTTMLLAQTVWGSPTIFVRSALAGCRALKCCSNTFGGYVTGVLHP